MQVVCWSEAGPKWKRQAAAVAPNHTAFTSVVADLAAAEAPSKNFRSVPGPSMDSWPFVDVGLAEETLGKGGLRSKRRDRRGRCQEPKGLPP